MEEEARAALRPAYAERSRREPALWDDAAYTGPNQPVVGVTWYEANAYCAWLSEMVGHPCRLPSETEWEAAARGGRVRLYPWGYRFDPARANTVEGRVLGTTPVGLYPRGVGPLGLWDGAGNVWEWTSSLYQPYPYRPDDGREDTSASGRRVRRGGGWSNNGRLARCASRLYGPPDGLFHLQLRVSGGTPWLSSFLNSECCFLIAESCFSERGSGGYAPRRWRRIFRRRD